MRNTGERIYRIGILGSYGGMNLGDEAILATIIQEIRRRVPAEITVFSFRPDDTRSRHVVEHVVPVRQITRTEVAEAIRPLDLFILGGGGILFSGMARAYLRGAQIAKEFGVPVMTWAIGVGPLERLDDRMMTRQVLDRVDLITVRDPGAHALLEEIGVSRDIVVTADPAFLLEPEPFPPQLAIREGIDPDSRLIGISVREPGPAAPDLDVGHYHSLLATTADYLVERMEATVLFVPMERPIDLQHSYAVMSRMANPQRALVLRGEYSPNQVLGLMSHLEFAIGMRLHFLMFAAMAGVPFVPLPYAAKVEDFARTLGMPTWTVQQISAGQLLAYVDRSWDIRADLRKQLEQHLPKLIERARRTGDLAADLLAGAHQTSPSPGLVSTGEPEAL